VISLLGSSILALNVAIAQPDTYNWVDGQVHESDIEE
jgi:hypothetical protein